MIHAQLLNQLPKLTLWDIKAALVTVGDDRSFDTPYHVFWIPNQIHPVPFRHFQAYSLSDWYSGVCFEPGVWPQSFDLFNNFLTYPGLKCSTNREISDQIFLSDIKVS